MWQLTWLLRGRRFSVERDVGLVTVLSCFLSFLCLTLVLLIHSRYCFPRLFQKNKTLGPLVPGFLVLPVCVLTGNSGRCAALFPTANLPLLSHMTL